MLDLQKRSAHGAKVEPTGDGWVLRIPANTEGKYHLAQLDDYLHLNRKNFPWQPPASLELRARASSAEIPGTWGFGFWNDPFSMDFGMGGMAQKFPALPNAAWFFFASPPNHLAFRDNHPAQGWLAATFRSRRIPLPVLALGVPLLPLLALPLTARMIRKAVRLFVQEDGSNLDVDVTAWHHYRLYWMKDCVRFFVDETLAHESRVSPPGPLGLVIWVDNQYAAFPPSGKVRMGTLRNPEEAWLEVKELSANRL